MEVRFTRPLAAMTASWAGWLKRRFGPRDRRRNDFGSRSATGLGDAADQLRHVMGASFYKKKVMSRSEYRVFRIVEAEMQAMRSGCRVLSQTSLGEIIGSDDRNAFSSINSKRVDILIVGPFGDPVAAIECQDGGHHQGNAAARDAIKREALRKAGVHFIEIRDHTSAEIAQLVRRIFPPRPLRSHPWAVQPQGG
ncbi:MAG: DUF2726 domain-containing protein [Rhizobiaceae bacterium]